jgi:hypothetical protein
MDFLGSGCDHSQMLDLHWRARQNRSGSIVAFLSHLEGSLWLFDVTTSKKRNVTWIGGLFLSKAR